MGQVNGRIEHDSPSPPVTMSSSRRVPVEPEYYGSPGSAPIHGSTSSVPKHKTLVRSLSQKGRRRPKPDHSEVDEPLPLPPPRSIKHCTAGSSGDMKGEKKAFGALVVRAECGAGIVRGKEAYSLAQHRRTPTVGTTTSSFNPSYRQHPQNSFRQTPMTSTPPHLRPSLTRRDSATSSIHSGRASVKSARRAEREWRAKVAALSTFTPNPSRLSTSPTKDRNSPVWSGPVHPRRRAPQKMLAGRTTSAPANNLGSTVLGSGQSTLSHNSYPFQPKSYPLKYRESGQSIIGRRSFETLGHHVASSTKETNETEAETGTEKEKEAGRGRIPSAPRSVSGGSALVEHEHDGDKKEREMISVDVATLLALEGAGKEVADRLKEELQQAKVDKEEIVREKKDIEEEAVVEEVEGEKEKVEKVEEATSLPRNNSPKPHPTFLALPSPPLSTPGLSSGEPSTPTNPLPTTPPPTSPPTPYSPMTAYLLFAPLETLGWASEELFCSRGSSNAEEPQTPMVTRHPYTLGKKDSPAPPSPPTPIKVVPPEGQPRSTETSAEVNIPKFWADQYSPRPLPNRPVPPPPSASPFISSSATAIFPRKKPQGHGPSHAHHTPSLSTGGPLQPRRHQHQVHQAMQGSLIKSEAIGERPEKVSAFKRYGQGGRGVVDLTPGMESGMRPPKTGLPKSELERWLATTIAPAT